MSWPTTDGGISRKKTAQACSLQTSENVCHPIEQAGESTQEVRRKHRSEFRSQPRKKGQLVNHCNQADQPLWVFFSKWCKLFLICPLQLRICTKWDPPFLLSRRPNELKAAPDTSWDIITPGDLYHAGTMLVCFVWLPRCVLCLGMVQVGSGMVSWACSRYASVWSLTVPKHRTRMLRRALFN